MTKLLKIINIAMLLIGVSNPIEAFEFQSAQLDHIYHSNKLERVVDLKNPNYVLMGADFTNELVLEISTLMRAVGEPSNPDWLKNKLKEAARRGEVVEVQDFINLLDEVADLTNYLLSYKKSVASSEAYLVGKKFLGAANYTEAKEVMELVNQKSINIQRDHFEDEIETFASKIKARVNGMKRDINTFIPHLAVNGNINDD